MGPSTRPWSKRPASRAEISVAGSGSRRRQAMMAAQLGSWHLLRFIQADLRDMRSLWLPLVVVGLFPWRPEAELPRSLFQLFIAIAIGPRPLHCMPAVGRDDRSDMERLCMMLDRHAPAGPGPNRSNRMPPCAQARAPLPLPPNMI